MGQGRHERAGDVERDVCDPVDPAHEVVGSGNVNADGKADILWRHATRGEASVWLMDGAVKQAEQYVGTVPDTGYRIVR